MIAHEHAVRVYFADTDAGGVMYHAAYLAFAEQARTEALRAAGHPHAVLLAEHGLIFMVQRLSLEYLRPARLDDLVRVSTTTRSVTAATIALRQGFRVAGEKIAELDVTLVCARMDTGRPARIPARWRAALAPKPSGALSGQ